VKRAIKSSESNEVQNRDYDDDCAYQPYDAIHDSVSFCCWEVNGEA